LTSGCARRPPSAGADTDWAQIAALHGALAGVLPSPVVELNRAIAVAMAGGLERGLALVKELLAFLRSFLAAPLSARKSIRISFLTTAMCLLFV
jgi:predicted RNA polymerase sigma factor